MQKFLNVFFIYPTLIISKAAEVLKRVLTYPTLIISKAAEVLKRVLTYPLS